jgi:hypothetical protein
MMNAPVTGAAVYLSHAYMCRAEPLRLRGGHGENFWQHHAMHLRTDWLVHRNIWGPGHYRYSNGAPVGAEFHGHGVNAVAYFVGCEAIGKSNNAVNGSVGLMETMAGFQATGGRLW